jgi:predicted amidohydrolase
MQRRSFIKKAGMGAAAAGAFGRAMASGDQTSRSVKPNHPDGDPEAGAMRVAVVQQEGNPGQVEENRNKALAFARQALDLKADAILFHEEMLVGYVENLKELAEPADGPTTKAFQELLKGTDARIIYGLTEKAGENYHISAPIVSADGLVANYRKAHLWWRAEGLRHEPTFYQPGNELVTFEVKGHQCGIMICYDGGFPEMARSYANLGCSVLFWMNNRRSRAHREVKDLAFGNSLYMPTSCCCGLNERGLFCEGASNITGPGGELISELWNDEGIVMADIYPEKVFALRENNYRYKGLRSDLYYYK